MKKKMYYLLPTLQGVGLLLICTAALYQFSALQRSADNIKYQQTESFASSLTNLAAAATTRYLSQGKTAELQLLIDDLSHDPIVRDATIYDDLGKIVYQSENILPLPDLLKINSDNQQQTSGATPYIAELYKENKKIGYIRITLEQEKILHLLQEYQEKSKSTILLLLIIAFVTGAALMGLFFTRVKNAYYYLAKRVYLLIRKNRVYW